MRLRPITLEECQQVRIWRNDPAVLPMLRTKAPITEAQQAAFYQAVVNNPDSDHLYYALEHDGVFVGMGGLTYLSRQPGEAEISLILGPMFRGQGLGSEAVDALVLEAKRLGLKTVIGECYFQGNQGFWATQLLRIPPMLYHTDMAGSLHWTWKIA